ELTRTRKIRRNFMEERYKDLIQAIYGDHDSVAINAAVTYRDGRKGTVATTIRVRTVEKEAVVRGG
ncbi:MAG: hypothetical protein HYX96_08570, partial [Chloroflexi bacterium]|nr:hypothetical protein [Chloroflexota bacterium]